VTVENGRPARSSAATILRAASPWPNSARKNPTTLTPPLPAAAVSMIAERTPGFGAEPEL
jgi:hypothetical protein